MSKPEPTNDDQREQLEAEIAELDQLLENLREIENALENAIILRAPSSGSIGRAE
jgi:hypothetical protein